MRKLTPVKVSDDQELSKQVGVQEISRSVPLSRDPKNFPVFRTPTNKKVLVYVPNHTVQDAEGKDQLRMDTPYIHIAQSKNNKYEYFRCVSGLHSDAFGYDGTCPLCEGAADPWTLANYIIEDRCKAQGLSPDDKDNDDVKNIKSKAYGDRVLNDAEKYYTFPIVVFDTVNDDAKTFVTDENGNMSYTIMWYSISERGYEKKWTKALENMEDEPTHPGGRFLVLDYTYTPKRGEPNARDSAREMTVYDKKIKNSEKLRAVLDQQTEAWTPEKAQEMVIRNNFYAYADLEAVTDELLENTRNLIALHEAKGATSDDALGINGDGDFHLEKKPEDEEAPVMMDETDDDMDME